jgi:hypothetical protein
MRQDPDQRTRSERDALGQYLRYRRQAPHPALGATASIEETARHAGQADLLRESIDGTVGE